MVLLFLPPCTQISLHVFAFSRSSSEAVVCRDDVDADDVDGVLYMELLKQNKRLQCAAGWISDIFFRTFPSPDYFPPHLGHFPQLLN